MSKMKKGVLITLVVVLLAAVGVFAYNFISENKLTEKERLIRGYEKLAEDSSPVNSVIGFEDISESFNSKQGKMALECTLEACSELEDIEGIGFAMDAKQNVQKKKAETAYNVTYRGTELASADMCVDKNTVYVALPAFFSEVLKLDLSKIEEAKDSAYIFSEVPEEAWEDVDFSLLNDIWKNYGESEKSSDSDKIGIVKDFADTYPDDVELIEKGIKVKEDKNGDLVLTISGNAIKVFINDCATFIFDCDKYKDTVSQILEAVNQEYDEDEKMTEKQLKNNLSTIATTVSAFFGDGLKLTTSLNDDNEITKIKFNYEYSIMNVDLSVDYVMNYTGKKKPSDECKGSFKVAAGEQAAEFKITGKNTKKGDVVTSKSKIVLDVMGGEYGSITETSTFNKAKGSYKYDVEGEIMGETASVAMNGKFSDIKKGKSFTFDMKELVIEAAGVDIELSGKLSMSNKAGSIKKPENGEEKDLLKMKEKDFDKLANEIEKNMDVLEEDLSELTEEF